MKIFGIFEKLYTRVEDVEELATGNEVEEDDEEIDEEEEEEKELPKVDSAEQAQALHLFRALNNKDEAPAMLAFLNTKLGGGVTKADLKSISLADILKEGFGEEYAFLAEKQVPALERAINSAIEAKLGTSLNDLRQANENLQREIATTKISAALDPIIEKMGSAEFDKIAPELAEVMERYPNNSNLPMKTYIKEMIKLTNKDSPEKSEKVKRNVREARRNLASGIEHKSVKIGSKVPSIREAVAAAMRGETFEED